MSFDNSMEKAGLPQRSSDAQARLPLTERLKHFTWAWFAICVSTGGIAVLLSALPFRFHGLYAIGAIFFIANLCFYLTFTCCIISRFVIHEKSLQRSLLHPNESFFFPLFFLTQATIIMGIYAYGHKKTGPWLIVAVRILYWIYTAVSLIQGVLHYVNMYDNEKIELKSVGPGWLLAVFPAMLVGTVSQVIAPGQPQKHALTIIIAGLTCQGLGILVSLMISSALVVRFVIYGLPPPSLRPGLFIMTGPPSFTGLALIGMGNAAAEKFPPGYITDAVNAGAVFQIIGLYLGIILWAFAFWFFCLALVCNLVGIRKMEFRVPWWAMIFPNVGFSICTFRIGEGLHSPAIQWVGEIMGVVVIAAYLVNFVLTIKAVITEQILYPGKDEDVPFEFFTKNSDEPWSPSQYVSTDSSIRNSVAE